MKKKKNVHLFNKQKRTFQILIQKKVYLKMMRWMKQKKNKNLKVYIYKIEKYVNIQNLIDDVLNKKVSKEFEKVPIFSNF